MWPNNIKKTILKDKECEKLPGLPPTAQKLVALEDTEVLGIKKGRNLLAYAVLSNPGYGEKRMLNHIYVNDTENTDILINLYAYIGEYCIDLDLDRIICRFIDTQDNLNIVHGLMMSLPQRPLLLNGHRMVYEMENTNAKELLDSHPAIKKILPYVKNKKDVEGLKYNRFYEELKRNGRIISAVTKDDGHDRYFEYEDKVIGYLNGFRTGKDNLIITDYYISDKKVQGYAFPAMLISLFGVTGEEFNKTGNLILQLYEEPVYRGIVNMLGTPKTDELIFEYVMMF